MNITEINSTNVFLSDSCLKEKPWSIPACSICSRQVWGWGRWETIFKIIFAYLIAGILIFPSMSYADDISNLPKRNTQENCATDEPRPIVGKNSHPWDLLKDKNFKVTYAAILRIEQLNERWLVSLNGPAPKNMLLNIDGKEFVYARSCKQHECGSHVIYLLYASQDKSTYGLLIENNLTRWLGNPPSCAKDTLRMLALKQH